MPLVTNATEQLKLAVLFGEATANERLRLVPIANDSQPRIGVKALRFRGQSKNLQKPIYLIELHCWWYPLILTNRIPPPLRARACHTLTRVVCTKASMMAKEQAQ